MELPAFLRAVAMRVRHWLVCSATSASSVPTGPVPETWSWFPMRTAREKPMIGSKGDVPGMLVRLVMRVGWLADLLTISRRERFYRAGPHFRPRVSRVFRGRERELPATPRWYIEG